MTIEQEDKMTDTQVRNAVAKYLKRGITVRKVVKHENWVRIFLAGVPAGGLKTAALFDHGYDGYFFGYGTCSACGILSDLS